MEHGDGFLQCQALIVAGSEISMMYSTKKDSMTVPIQVYLWHKKTKVSTLLDSGATHNFIDKQAIKSLGLGTQVLLHPWVVHNVSGTKNKEEQSHNIVTFGLNKENKQSN